MTTTSENYKLIQTFPTSLREAFTNELVLLVSSDVMQINPKSSDLDLKISHFAVVNT